MIECLKTKGKEAVMTFADKGDDTYEMSTEHAKTPITSGYRIEGDTLYSIDLKLGIEEAYTRNK